MSGVNVGINFFDEIFNKFFVKLVLIYKLSNSLMKNFEKVHSITVTGRPNFFLGI